jgi:DNA-binding NarL/FixJ family response regulator
MIKIMKVLLVDDHLLVRDGISLVLEEFEPGMTVVNASTCGETRELLAECDDIDLVLLDIGLPDVNGLDCLKAIRNRDPLLPVVMLSGLDNPEKITAAIESGARGFIPKSAKKEIMLSVIRLVMAGGIYMPDSSLMTNARTHNKINGLTPRQREVLRLLAEGLPNKAIANTLGMAEATVRVHVTSILRNLKVNNRTEAAIKAREIIS